MQLRTIESSCEYIEIKYTNIADKWYQTIDGDIYFGKSYTYDEVRECTDMPVQLTEYNFILHKKEDKIFFKVNEVITEEMAQLIQELHGYHPAGYGFMGFNMRPLSELCTIWYCYNSCD